MTVFYLQSLLYSWIPWSEDTQFAFGYWKLQVPFWMCCQCLQVNQPSVTLLGGREGEDPYNHLFSLFYLLKGTLRLSVWGVTCLIPSDSPCYSYITVSSLGPAKALSSKMTSRRSSIEWCEFFHMLGPLPSLDASPLYGLSLSGFQSNGLIKCFLKISCSCDWYQIQSTNVGEKGAQGSHKTLLRFNCSKEF